MKFAALHLRQRDGVTCGPTVAVVAGALLDPGRQAGLSDPAWFADEQARVHAKLNRALGKEIEKQEIALRATPEGFVISLHELGFFDSGQAQLLPGAADKIKRIAAGRGFCTDRMTRSTRAGPRRCAWTSGV